MGEQRLVQIRGVVVFRRIRASPQHLLQIDAPALSLAPPFLAIGINHFPNIFSQEWMENLRASINFLPEYVPRFIETVAHADVVISDTRKQENDRPSCGFLLHAGENAPGVLLGQGGNGILPAGRDEAPSVRERPASPTPGGGQRRSFLWNLWVSRVSR